MATTVESKVRDPQSSESYSYHSSGNYNPGGTTVTVNVTPSDKRITGATESGKAQRDSISRQYAPTEKAASAA
jgi:hypothetical protein